MADQRLQALAEVLEQDEAAIKALEAAHDKTGEALFQARCRLAVDKQRMRELVDEICPDEPALLSVFGPPVHTGA